MVDQRGGTIFSNHFAFFSLEQISDFGMKLGQIQLSTPLRLRLLILLLLFREPLASHDDDFDLIFSEHLSCYSRAVTR